MQQQQQLTTSNTNSDARGLPAERPIAPATPTSSRAQGPSSPARHAQPQSQNGHGRRRVYRCRHCAFATECKTENWRHIRVHMRPERVLACDSCEFVTEYKHHLEYHQRNHSGFKPFRCEHCDYQCVNKSMLNSHSKSHSSLYAYKCGQCKYATKYVHSLKMHLRKYGHQPSDAAALDVYGRKRGPKPAPPTSTSAARPPSQGAQSRGSLGVDVDSDVQVELELDTEHIDVELDDLELVEDLSSTRSSGRVRPLEPSSPASSHFLSECSSSQSSQSSSSSSARSSSSGATPTTTSTPAGNSNHQRQQQQRQAKPTNQPQVTSSSSSTTNNNLTSSYSHAHDNSHNSNNSDNSHTHNSQAMIVKLISDCLAPRLRPQPPPLELLVRPQTSVNPFGEPATSINDANSRCAPVVAQNLVKRRHLQASSSSRQSSCVNGPQQSGWSRRRSQQQQRHPTRGHSNPASSLDYLNSNCHAPLNLNVNLSLNEEHSLIDNMIYNLKVNVESPNNNSNVSLEPQSHDHVLDLRVASKFS